MTLIIALGVFEVQNFPGCCCLNTDNPSMYLRKYKKMENLTEMPIFFHKCCALVQPKQVSRICSTFFLLWVKEIWFKQIRTVDPMSIFFLLFFFSNSCSFLNLKLQFFSVLQICQMLVFFCKKMITQLCMYELLDRLRGLMYPHS